MLDMEGSLTACGAGPLLRMVNPPQEDEGEEKRREKRGEKAGDG